MIEPFGAETARCPEVHRSISTSFPRVMDEPSEIVSLFHTTTVVINVVNLNSILLSSHKIKINSVCVSSLPIRGEDGCFLYGVFNGYDGSRVANFASQRLTAELLLGQINSSHTDNDIRRILTQVFSHSVLLLSRI